jgi:hypothetical protein
VSGQYPSRAIAQKGERARRRRKDWSGIPLAKEGYELTTTPTKAEQERLNRIAELGCVLSYVKSGQLGTPGTIHHLITERIPGRRNGHDMTICLAPRYHQDSNEALHHLGPEGFAALHGISEMELLIVTNKLLEAVR